MKEGCCVASTVCLKTLSSGEMSDVPFVTSLIQWRGVGWLKLKLHMCKITTFQVGCRLRAGPTLVAVTA